MDASSSIVASVSSTAAHSNNNLWYDVFINHRGVDVKKTFARSLYLRLLEKGLTAFLDQEELQQGYNFPSQIEHAIRTASAHVAIFSPRYAESYWCLDELLLMLESKAPIVPVFYRVTPAQVRWTQGTDGTYDQALKRLAEKRTREGKLRYDSNKIESWRNAMSLVADNSGFELEACNDEELQLELLEKVVKRLSEMVKKPDLHVAKYPTGLDEKLKQFEDTFLLQRHMSQKPRMLGIWGLGGIGKTTLAKEFFNKKSSDYHVSCFLSDVRDNAAKGSLTSLQRKLLKSLIGLDKTIDNVDEGKGMLIKPLKSYKALVIIDDVDDVNQVDALLPIETHNLHTGSLILITSRDCHVLISSRVEKSSIYKLTGLNTQHSLALFCNHAFSQPYPLPKFTSLVNEFLKVCNGLPLSLKVFGALLYGRDISDWKDELGSLQQILPDEIHKAFIRSYNKLNKQEQHIFLDIACFFIGENRDTAIGIWDKSGWRGRRGFQNLINKCLVEVDSTNAIQMHDHVRDLRIDVAEVSSPRRFWRWTENVIDTLLSSPETTVRGIRMVRGASNAHDEDNVFGVIDSENALRMVRGASNAYDEDNVFGVIDSETALLEGIFRRLQIFDTETAFLERILRRVELRNLIWLSWKRCPHSSLPSWLLMKNLRVLRVPHSQLNTLWERGGELQGAQLPVCLEELWAHGCVKLKSIRGLEQLTKLRLLHVSGCFQLEELPSMETLVFLESLKAEECVKFKSIRGLAQCTKLRILDVSGCSALEELPSMETLVSLGVLNARKCVKLKSILGLTQCTELQRLDVSDCSELEDLPNMETLVSLERLYANGCVKFKSIRGLAQCIKLRILDVSGCSALEKLPSMETLVSLGVLNARECVKLKSILGLTQCTELQQLDVSDCSELEELPNMETLVSLESLVAERCVKIKSIRGLAQCTKLRVLYVSGSSELEELPCMETLVALEGLEADGCVKLKNIRGLEPLTKLGCLSVSGCLELEELPNMETFVYLEGLQVDGCVKLKSIGGLAQCTTLRLLNITGCCELEELPSMETCVSLEQLRTDNCLKLKNIRGLAQCTKLRLLYVSDCTELKELPSMETLVSLEELWADGSVKLKSIQGLAHLKKLRRLIVSGCSELKELSGTEGLVSLQDLWAKGCVKLKSIGGLTQCTKLLRLCINGCFELEGLPSMESLISLEELQAGGCVKLKSIWGLAQCTKLRILIVRGCSELEEVEGVEHMSLEMIDVYGCPKLQCPVWE